MMPEYPATANEGILHFIHLKNPFKSQSRDPIESQSRDSIESQSGDSIESQSGDPVESQSRDPRDISEKQVNKTFTKIMSKVIIFRGIYRFMLRPSRYNSLCIIKENLMSRNLNYSLKKMIMMLGRHYLRSSDLLPKAVRRWCTSRADLPYWIKILLSPLFSRRSEEFRLRSKNLTILGH